MMQVAFVFDVSFMNAPMLPPTQGNCDKCCFDRRLCHAIKNMDVCVFGREGYFVQDKITGTRVEERLDLVKTRVIVIDTAQAAIRHTTSEGDINIGGQGGE
jgi:hypothetical protein